MYQRECSAADAFHLRHCSLQSLTSLNSTRTHCITAKACWVILRVAGLQSSHHSSSEADINRRRPLLLPPPPAPPPLLLHPPRPEQIGQQHSGHPVMTFRSHQDSSRPRFQTTHRHQLASFALQIGSERGFALACDKRASSGHAMYGTESKWIAMVNALVQSTEEAPPPGPETPPPSGGPRSSPPPQSLRARKLAEPCAAY